MPAEDVTPRLARHAWYATAVVALASLAFVVTRPAVGDMWAALARARAVREGVGLGYWFSWYSGAHPPGGYSVIVPWLSALLGAHLVVAFAALAIPWAVALTVTGVRRPIAAVWISAISAVLTLGAGRTTFLVGAVIAIGALDAAIRDKRWLACGLVLLAGLASPVAVAFVLVGLVAGFLHHRMSVAPIVVGLLFMGASSALWGSSGPEGYGWVRASLSLVFLAVFFFASPARPVKFAVIIAGLSVVVFSAFPNAMGSNLARLVFAVLPIAVAATSRRGKRFTALAVGPALIWSAYFTAQDLGDAHRSASSVKVYTPLIEALKRQPGIETSRVEVAADGTHPSAYVLAQDFWLARGYETQADRALSDAFVDREASISSEHLTSWLRSSSVRYVAVNRHPVKRTGEWRTANGHPAGWREVWSDRHWTLYEVSGTQPLLGRGVTLVNKSPSQLTVRVDGAVRTQIRVRWTKFLHARAKEPGVSTTLERSPQGWVELSTSAPSEVELYGRP